MNNGSSHTRSWQYSEPCLLLGFSDQRFEHALNHQLLRGDEIGILGVLGFQVGLATFQDKRFKRAFTVDERGDHLAVARLRTVLQDDHIPSQDMPDRKSTRLNSSHLVISYA